MDGGVDGLCMKVNRESWKSKYSGTCIVSRLCIVDEFCSIEQRAEPRRMVKMCKEVAVKAKPSTASRDTTGIAADIYSHSLPRRVYILQVCNLWKRMDVGSMDAAE